MNKDRRNRLKEVSSTIQDTIIDVQEILDDEQEAFDNLPESLQYSERAERMLAYVGNMDSLIADLEDCDNSLQQIINM